MASLNKIKDEELINILQEIFNDNWKLKILYSLYNKNKRFFAPVGFDIGGITHESIALSICSQIEARKNNKI